MRKVLIANRGEIAVRVIRACRELGLATVAVYSDCDRSALHVRLADQAYPLDGDTARDTYLSIDKLLAVARASGADAVHPGYGFLAEHAGFAAACRAAELTYIGPSAHAIDTMGSKTAARAAAAAAGVPMVPGSRGPVAPGDGEREALRQAAELGYPLFVKAVAGGGGKGMRLVHGEADLPDALRAARSEALSAFGDGAVYLERRLERPRHVEVQLLGDGRGTLVAFVERECSIQRRHQKLVEESPSLAVDAATRRALAEAALRVARHVGYTNAGTIEFLLAPDGMFYFLEMNTRLQVEHPVTEAVTGVDLVQWQLRLAAGDPLTIDPVQALTPRAHAIEARIYAEDPDTGFLPSPGKISVYRPPSGPGIREDAGVSGTGEVPIYYDPLLAKLIAWGGDRQEAIARLARALDEYQIEGVRTTVSFFRWLVGEPDFLSGEVDTGWLDRVLARLRPASGRLSGGSEEPGFLPVDEDTVRLVAAVAAVAADARARTSSPGASVRAAAADAWMLAARREALR